MSTHATPYYAMIRSTHTKFAVRHNLILHALQHGVRATATHFGCSRNTVRKWLRRYRCHHLQGLHALRRAPLSCPHKTKPPLEQKVLALRRKTPGFSARRLIAEFALPLGHNAVNRILRVHGLTRRRKRRHQTKRDLRAIKAAYKPFTRFRMDTKYLTDLPVYWPQMQQLDLPRFQTTIRECSVGAQFLAYSNELSKTYATLTADRFLAHLTAHGVDLREVEIRTDLGTEFDGDTVSTSNRPASSAPSSSSGVPATSSTRRIVPTPTPMSKPCTARSRANSSTRKPSRAGATSSPKSTPTNSGTTSPARTAVAAGTVPWSY